MASLHVFNPIQSEERLQSIDVLRGIALLGILLMNIVAMGLPYAYYHPSPMSGWNLRVWEINALFFEGTMRALFTMLFGAGMVILTLRGEAKGGGIGVADLYYRRLLWLLGLSLIHAYVLLFYGEVLFYYALLGLLLFPLRKIAPLPLLMAGFLLLSISAIFSITHYQNNLKLQQNASIALSLQKEGKTLNPEQSASLEAWKGELQRAAVTPQMIKKEIEETRGSYVTLFKSNAGKVKIMHTLVFHDAFFWDLLACMLLGMALYKWGVFQGKLSKKWYGIMAFVGYAAGLSINLYEINLIEKGNFSLMVYLQAEQTYHAGRIFMTMGHIGLILLVVKLSFLSFLQRALAAVGRMALTNYVSHSIFSLVLFSGVGLKLFGQLERYQLYYIVLAIWTFQLIMSPIWLHYFQFGPLEWVWRSLTYNKIQPFKRINNANKHDLQEGQMPEYTLATK